MSKWEKLKQRFKTRPKDFTWSELVTLMNRLGFELLNNKGSKRKFFSKENNMLITVHQPHHPHKTILSCYVNDICDVLEREEIL